MQIAATVIAIAAMSLALPAGAGEPEEQETRAEEKAEEPKKICRRIQTTVGSRTKERVCMTREQWREFNRGE